MQAPLAFDAHCMMNVGLRADYVSPLPMPPLEQHHYPKHGLAMTGSAKMEPLQVMTANDARRAPFEKSLAADVVRAELTDIRFVDRRDPRRFRPISEFSTTPLARRAARRRQGNLDHGDRTLGGESYEILEMTSAGVTVLLTVQGGWCKTLGN